MSTSPVGSLEGEKKVVYKVVLTGGELQGP